MLFGHVVHQPYRWPRPWGLVCTNREGAVWRGAWRWYWASVQWAFMGDLSLSPPAAVALFYWPDRAIVFDFVLLHRGHSPWRTIP